MKVHAIRGWRSRKVIPLHANRIAARTSCGIPLRRVEWTREEDKITCVSCLLDDSTRKPCPCCGTRDCDCLGELLAEQVRPGVEDELAPHAEGMHEGRKIG